MLDALASMDEREKTGQLFCVMGGDYPLDELRALVSDEGIGAVLYRPCPKAELAEKLAAIDAAARIPLLHAANLEEGGAGGISDGTYFANQLGVAAADDEACARRFAEVCAAEGLAAGADIAKIVEEKLGLPTELYEPLADELHGPASLPEDRLTLVVANLPTASNQTAVRINWSRKHALDDPRFINEEPAAMISVANPYHLQDAPRIRTYINAYTPIAPASSPWASRRAAAPRTSRPPRPRPARSGQGPAGQAAPPARAGAGPGQSRRPHAPLRTLSCPPRGPARQP